METRFTPEHRMVRTSSHYISSSNEDVMVKRIMQTHFPDGSSVDSESLMFMVEDILRQSCDPNLLVSEATRIANGGDGTQSVCVHASEVKTIYRLSYEVMSRCFGEGNQHAATMALLDSLGNNPWDEKVALVLAAFAITYGEFLLVKQLCPSNPLATSIATFMQVFHYLQQDKETLQPCFKVLNCLAKTLINAARSIIEFESLPMEYITLNIEAFAATKTCLHLAAYWVIRSAVACSSLITDLITRSHDHVHVLS
ncbi:hypothetical protein H6P81_012594 [Aristolochia fimbriata]|uniref:Sieve element occlusion N-terminal domain-containing protein n=1 Tax=Aristolochia fimbriata TaxID=158543 RepID=A0AAV7EDJ5_ARIFI|nr:hypothetical protein H6P81_012594 [Aristolochia fimbriata]